MVGGNCSKVVLYIVLVMALCIEVYSENYGTCLDLASGACDYIDLDVETCPEDQGFVWYPGKEPNEVANCTVGCCCGAKFSNNPVYPVTKGQCEILYKSMFLDVDQEECNTICSQVTLETPLCNADCQLNTKDCIGRGGETIDIDVEGQYYCWEDNNTYTSQSECSTYCLEVSCDDGMKNQDETDIDCGGSCPRCIDGKQCLIDSDCQSNYCNPNNLCSTTTCLNGIKDMGEVGIDCGGLCPNQDCCTNGYQDTDLNETDVDCGGSCLLCGNGKRCNINSDCKNEWCKQGICKSLPVLLVHGIYGSSESWDPSMFSEFEVVDTLNLTPSNGDIKKLALQLKNKVRQMKEEHHVNKIDIVSHSMGGLVSRWYTQNDYQNDVRKLIMIGTPNHGSDWGYLKDIGFVHSVLGGIITNLLVGPAGAQMIPHSGFLEELNGNSKCADKREGFDDRLNEVVEHYTIWSNCCGTLTHFHKYINTSFGSIEFIWPGFSEGDFIVPKDSTKLDTVSSKQVGTYFHVGQGKTEEIVEEVKKMLNGVQIAGLLSTYHMLGTAEENEYLVHTVKIAMDVLHQGETKEYNIHLDNSSKNTHLILNFGESELNFSLRSPSGLVITQNSSPGITYSSVESLMQYYVPNPEIGDWTLSIEGLNVTNSEVNFSLVAFIETDLILGLSAGGYHFKPGERVNISALFSKYLEPIVNATVNVTIKKPGNFIETFFLYDDGTHNDIKAGDGIYTNYFTASLEGAYDITANANISLDGRKIVRNAQLTIWVESYPDLIIKNISFSNIVPVQEDNVTITALIENIGEKEALNATIEFYHSTKYEDDLIGEVNISVGIGEEVMASINWTNLTEGNYNVTVLISPFNSFLEKNYLNNRLKKELYIPSKSKKKPTITIISPINNTIYQTTSIDLNWTVDKDVSWCAYSLDNKSNNTSIYLNYLFYQEDASYIDVINNDNPSYLYTNYTKPSKATDSSKWQVKHGYNGSNALLYNITLPKACWDAYEDELVLRIISYHGTGINNSEPQCYNGSKWIDIGVKSNSSGLNTSYLFGDQSLMYDGNWDTGVFWHIGWLKWGVAISGYTLYGMIYEEAMWWNLSAPINITLMELSEGPHNIIIYCNDASGNMGQSDYVHFIIKKSQAFNMSLNKGWNLISIPLNLTDKSPNFIFSGLNTSVYSYKNNSWFVPNKIDNELGYWLKINESKNLTLMGTEMENITMDLNEGWNLISYPSFNTTSVNESLKDLTYDIILTYENNKWLSYSPSKPSYLNTLKNLTSWHGYWVKVPYNATWTFDGIFK